MANEIKLEAFSFGIRSQKNSKEEKAIYLPLNDFFEGKDFIQFFQDYLKFIETEIEINDSIKKAIRLKENSLSVASKKRMLSGVFESGEYGYESDIINIKDSKRKIKKEIDDIEILPFYFLLYVPDNKDIGILMLQRFGIFGITTVFKYSFIKFFNSRYKNVVIEFNPFVSKELAETFITKGGIKEVVLRKYDLPEDIADKYHLREYTKKILSVELRIKAKPKMFFTGLNKSVKSFIADANTKFFDVKELKQLGFDGSHKISVISRFNGTDRTIDLSDTGQIRPYYDIDNKVEKEKSSHPKFESIDKEAKQLLEEFLNEIIRK